MAVEARHMNLLFSSPQLSAINREMMINPMTMEANATDTTTTTTTAYNNHLLQVRYGVPMSATAAVDTACLLPMYSSGICDSLPPRTPLKSDSGITNYNVPAAVVSRKRSRDSPSPTTTGGLLFPSYTAAAAVAAQRDSSRASSFSFLGEDISIQMQQQQFDIDRLIAQHTEKVRLEIEEKRKNQERMVLEAIEERLLKRLRTKEDEIQKMAKLNYALGERVKSLCVENKIWRDLAHSNEATANALRTNLHQVLLSTAHHHVHNKDDDNDNDDAAALAPAKENPLMDDAQSCCDSCGWDEISPPGTSQRAAEDEVESAAAAARDRRWCRNCGKGEARVLLLPCRHLCLCGVCGSSVHTCPVCKSAKTASVHVNVSSS